MSLVQVLATPLSERCTLLSRLLCELNTPLHELASSLPDLLADIFGGAANPTGWSLALITHSCHPAQFQQIRQFLSPEGPLFNCMFRLSADANLTYQLPTSTESKQTADISLYSTNDSLHSQTWPNNSTPLRPIQLYMRQFCRYLSILNNTGISWSSPGDALYPTLLEDLLQYFLPCGATWLPSLQLGGTGAPVNTFATAHVANSPPRTITTPHRLLRQDCLQRHNTPLSAASLSPQASPLSSPLALRQSSVSTLTPSIGTAANHYSTETWSSQCVVDSLVDTWLSVPAVAMETAGAYQLPAKPADSVFSVPSHDHVRLVRMLIKHIHFFINSPHHLPGLEHFKRHVQMLLQSHVFPFLSHCCAHWPSDTSFRLLVETWLSYIQPWRYIDYTDRNRLGKGDAGDTTVDGSWRQFITDNVTCYSAMFCHVVERLQRLQLNESKFAYIVFRVAKVMCQPGLMDLLRQAEVDDQPVNLLSPTDQHHHHHQHHQRLTGGHLVSDPGHVTACTATLLVGDLTGMSQTSAAVPAIVSHSSMFDAACQQQVRSLVFLLAGALTLVSSQCADSQVITDGAAGDAGGMWRQLVPSLEDIWRSLLSLGSGVGDTAEDEEDINGNLDQLRKTCVYLQTAISLLTEAYQLPVPDLKSLFVDECDVLSAGDSPFASMPCPAPVDSTPGPVRAPLRMPARSTLGSSPSVLTPSALQSPLAFPGARHRSALLRNRPGPIRRGTLALGAAVEPVGDPEFWPVRGDEVAMLVTLTRKLADKVNLSFGEQIRAHYSGRDIYGHLLRRLLLPPSTFRQLGRPGEEGGRGEQEFHTPARLSLRWLASRRLLFYTALLWQLVTLWLGGLGGITAVGVQVAAMWLLLLMVVLCFVAMSGFDLVCSRFSP